jgi:hypothetical protein
VVEREIRTLVNSVIDGLFDISNNLENSHTVECYSAGLHATIPRLCQESKCHKDLDKEDPCFCFSCSTSETYLGWT